jgi:hypothetical protein
MASCQYTPKKTARASRPQLEVAHHPARPDVLLLCFGVCRRSSIVVSRAFAILHSSTEFLILTNEINY